MSGENSIEAEGRIVKAIGNGRFWLELENGHRLVAHVTKRTQKDLGKVSENDSLQVEVSPFDLSKGRIV